MQMHISPDCNVQYKIEKSMIGFIVSRRHIFLPSPPQVGRQIVFDHYLSLSCNADPRQRLLLYNNAHKQRNIDTWDVTGFIRVLCFSTKKEERIREP